MFTRGWALALSLTSALAGAQTLQEQGPPLHRVVHKNTLALRLNPLGLLYDGRFAYRLRLYQSESVALRDNFLGVGVAPVASPAFLRIGPYVEVSPLTVLNFWAAIQFVQYFGSFSLFQSFPSANSNFSDARITRLNKGTDPEDPTGALKNYVTNGWEVTLGANLQVKVSSVVLRSMARLVNGHMAVRPGDRVYYDQYYDVAAPNDGWYLTNDLDVLYQGLENRLVVGARYTVTAPFYDRRHIDPGLGETIPNNSMHRVGPFAAYTFKFQDGATFNTPTVFLLVQWWLMHRYRTGPGCASGCDTVTQALPLIGVGFQMTGDFLPLK